MSMQKLESLINDIKTFCPDGPERQALIEFLWHPMVQPRLIKAPASSQHSHHHAQVGGLLDHIRDMLKTAQDVTLGLTGLSTLQPGEENLYVSSLVPPIRKIDLVLAVVLHDMNKLGDATGQEEFEPNFLKSGKVSDAKPWVHSKETNKFAGCVEVARTAMQTLQAEPMSGSSTSDAVRQLSVLLDRNPGIFPEGELSISLVAALSPKLYALLSSDVLFTVRYHDGAYGCGKYELGGKETPLQMIVHFADMWSSRVNTLAYRPRE